MYFHLSISKKFTTKVSQGLIFLTAVPYYIKITDCYVAIHFLRLLILLLRAVLNYKEICGLSSVSNMCTAAVFVGTVGE